MTLFPDFLFPVHAWIEYETPVLRTGVIIGFMQSGKTVLARHLAAQMFRAVVGSGYDDDTYRYIEVLSLRKANELVKKELDPERQRFLFIFVDDAVKEAHSRQRNVNETKLFVDVRHWTLKRGVLTICYATQDFMLLDRLMRSAMVYMWKTLPLDYYIDPNARERMYRYIGNPDFVGVLEEITSNIYDSNPSISIPALKTSVVRIPVKKYGPKLYVDIPVEEPPRDLWIKPEDKEEREGEGEQGEINDNIIALIKAIHRLAQVTGVRLKVNRQKYLIARLPDKREISLGPIAELVKNAEPIQAYA